MAVKRGSDSSVAPKERINIVYKPATGGRNESIELPMKTMVLGDFTKREDGALLEERAPIEVNRRNLDEVLKSMNVGLKYNVKNTLKQGEKNISVDLKIEKMKDFSPDAVVESIPELKKVLELREALKALKAPLGNVSSVRNTIRNALRDDSVRKKLQKELDD